ncbi:oxidoreductase-like protein [Thozetella sp. PMI_491]|nr:oxidoreductase-like protein [Thozetella sp. PMI_491]
MTSSPRTRTVPTVDISAFTTKAGDEQRRAAGVALVEALHDFGFVKVTGHGFSIQELREALRWVKKLFDLPTSDKMKAPHPPGPFPHRGYSGIGREKVYSRADIEAQGDSKDVAKSLRKISDFKESYEIGSESDTEQQNIWLPEEVLPDFRAYMSALYERLAGVSKTVLDAIGVGLELDGADYSALMGLKQDHQLRLLHYPAITKEKLSNELLARLPAHRDWSTYTMLFQDENGGLELKDPKTQEFLEAEPEEGALVLNTGDMLQRFTNNYFISALHQVAVPSPETVPEEGIPARHSIPFFVAPSSSHVIATLPKFITAENPAKYEPVRFDQYSTIVSKYQY